MLMVSDKDLLTMSDTQYKEHYDREKAEARKQKKEDKEDIKLQAEANRIVRNYNDRKAREKAEKLEKATAYAKEKQKNYAKIQSKLSGKKSRLEIKIPHYGIKIRKAEPKPEQKPYFKPVKSNVGFFGRGNL
jgi:hypothetical protein